MAKLTVLVEDDLMHRFKLVALREHKSVSELVRDFMVFYVDKKEKNDG